MNKIYLEISGRAQGKTYRLTKAVIKHLQQDLHPLPIAFVYTPTERAYKHIVNRVVEYTSNESLRERIICWGREGDINNASLIKKVNGKRFFDDFDIRPPSEYKDQWITKTNFKPIEGDYYCTSSFKVRNPEVFIKDNNDFLKLLLDFNGGQYESFFNPTVLNLIEEKDCDWGNVDFKREFLGTFVA
jgi:hypothetical protein